MDLENRCQLRPRENSLNRSSSILGDGVGLVAATGADVQARQNAGRHPAAAAEKAVWCCFQRIGAKDFDAIHNVSRMMVSSSAWLPTMKA